MPSHPNPPEESSSRLASRLLLQLRLSSGQQEEGSEWPGHLPDKERPLWKWPRLGPVGFRKGQSASLRHKTWGKDVRLRAGSRPPRARGAKASGPEGGPWARSDREEGMPLVLQCIDTFRTLPGCCGCWRLKRQGLYRLGTAPHKLPLRSQGKDGQQTLLLVTGEETLLLQGGLGRRGSAAPRPRATPPLHTSPHPPATMTSRPAVPTNMRFLSLSSSCTRRVRRWPSSWRASSCRRLSSWLRSFSRQALCWIWRKETTKEMGVGQPRAL